MGWYQLISSIKDNAENAERDQPPECCPHDGALLVERADGVRDCPMGNFRWEP